MESRSRPRARLGFANAVAIIVVTVVVVGAVIGYVMRDEWLLTASESIRRQVDILSQIVVGVGTAALAAVTWASVYETQRVIADEDLRFRRSRMPMLKISASPETNRWNSNPQYEVVVVNDGDGAARAVRLTLRAMVTVRWNKEGLADSRDECFERTFHCNESFVSAYIRKRSRVVYTLEQQGENQMVVNALVENNLEHAEIVYEDVFGETYRTTYPMSPAHEYDPERFLWEPPSNLGLGI